MEKIREAFKEFCNIEKWCHPIAVTLTMRLRSKDGEPASIVACSQNMRFFLTSLCRRIYKNAARRGLKRLKVIPVVEQDTGGRFHYHIAIDRPAHVPPEYFAELIIENWQRTRFGYEQVHIVTGADDGWIDYMAKFRSKANYADAIDWVNVRVA